MTAESASKLNAGTGFRAKLARVDVATHDLVEALTDLRMQRNREGSARRMAPNG
jgi:hypothetical protein